MRISDWSSDVCSSDLHAVEESGDIGGTQQLAVGCEMRPLEDDVVTLPLAGFARRVHQRRLPRIDRADGAVGIGRVPIAVEDLELVTLHEPDAAVAEIGRAHV